MALPHRLSWQKRTLFKAVIAAAVYGFAEIVCLVYIGLFSGDVAQSRRASAKADATSMEGAYHEPMMVHPYIGVVYQPKPDDKSRSPGSIGINEYGLLDDQPPQHRRGPDKVIIGIIGGSVAKQLALRSTRQLAEELASLPQFSGKNFEFVRLAIDGQKQPQHLMSINYLLATGGELDVLICVDGVNEIALPAIDNVPFGVSAAFPRKWSIMTSGLNSIELTRLIGFLMYLRDQRIGDAAFFDAVPLRYSPLVTLVWQTRDRWTQEKIAQQLKRIQRQREQETLSPRSSGPKESFSSETELLEHSAEIWCRSAIAMEGVCKIHGIRFFHFLQPNQYLPNSRDFGADEASVAINPESPFGRPVELGYPMLRSRADRLREAGVDFTDLTQLYREAAEQVYSDDCCHMTEHGDALMIQAIAGRIRTRMAGEIEIEQPAKGSLQ